MQDTYTSTRTAQADASFGLLQPAKPGQWRVELFGMGPMGITLQPQEGRPVPCWFWRQMQYLFLGNKWVKING